MREVIGIWIHPLIKEELKMNLEGLKINFLGDSITEGHGVSCIENTYWNVLKREEKLSVARGYGISGTRFAKKRVPSENPRWDLDFISRFPDMDDDADAVVIFGGTNDFGHGDAPLGEMSDRGEYTFYGACHTLFNGVINKYPEATIVIMTPLHRIQEDNPRGDGNKKDGEGIAPLSLYVEIIKEVAAYYSLPVLDLWSVSGIQPKVSALRERYCPDGLHPNDEGHKIIASRLAGFLKSI